MTQEETLEYNKRCAEFLNLHRDEEVAIYKMTAYPYDFLKFDSDWNWIMEMVEAIEKLKDEEGYRWRVDMYLESCQIINTHNFEGNLIYKQTSKKEAVVQAINQFLIWYNNNKL